MKYKTALRFITKEENTARYSVLLPRARLLWSNQQGSLFNHQQKQTPSFSPPDTNNRKIFLLSLSLLTNHSSNQTSSLRRIFFLTYRLPHQELCFTSWAGCSLGPITHQIHSHHPFIMIKSFKIRK